MRYYIADTHFFHGNLNTKMDHRGFESVEAMNQYMLKQWNNKVRKNDEVVILGDLSWGTAQETNELLEQFQTIAINTDSVNPDGTRRTIPCNMINCFCMYSDYVPLTLDEWIACNQKRQSYKM